MECGLFGMGWGNAQLHNIYPHVRCEFVMRERGSAFQASEECTGMGMDEEMDVNQFSYIGGGTTCAKA